MKKWFLSFADEAVGPFDTDRIRLLLRQRRLHFADFIWAPGLSQWMRISYFREFESEMAPLPSLTPPMDSEAAEVPSREYPTASTQMDLESEVRIRRRLRTRVDASVWFDDDGVHEAIDISEGGVRVKAAFGVRVGVELSLKINVRQLHKIILATGRVQRIVSDPEAPGFVIAFTHLSDEDRQILRKHIALRESAQARKENA